MQKIRYPSLNGLRALSIIIVIIHHLSLKFHIFQSINSPLLSPLLLLITDGGMGVNVFFIISGFLITSLMLKEESATGTVSFKKFYTRRCLRIFPAYYFLLLVYFVLQQCGFMSISRGSWLTAITYTKYLNWNRDWYTVHFWSLSIEEQFYLFWPLLFILGDKTRKIAAFCLLALVPVVKGITFSNPVYWITDLSILERIDAIALGCLCAIYQAKITSVMSKGWTLCFYLAAALLFVLYTPLATNGALMERTGRFYAILFTPTGTIGNALLAALMMYAVFGPHNFFFQLLNTRVMNFIGMLSYSLYLWQQIFIMPSPYFVNRLPVNILFLVVAALGSYYLVERPFLKLKSRFEKIPTEQTAYEK